MLCFRYINGDRWTPGKLVVLDTKALKLLSVTHLIDSIAARWLPWGPAERLYRIGDGRRIVKLTMLRHGGRYVLAKREPFVRDIQYEAIKPAHKRELERKKEAERKLGPRRDTIHGLELPGIKDHRSGQEGKAVTVAAIGKPVRVVKQLDGRKRIESSGENLRTLTGKVIYLIVSGDTRNKFKKFLLDPRNASSSDQIFQRATNALRVPGPVRKIWTIEGNQVKDVPAGLIDGGTYVVTYGYQKFRRLDYTPFVRPRPKERRMRAPKLRRRPQPILHVRHTSLLEQNPSLRGTWNALPSPQPTPSGSRENTMTPPSNDLRPPLLPGVKPQAVDGAGPAVEGLYPGGKDAPAPRKKRERFTPAELVVLGHIRSKTEMDRLWDTQVDGPAATGAPAVGHAPIDTVEDVVRVVFPELAALHPLAVQSALSASLSNSEAEIMNKQEFMPFLLNLFYFGKVLYAVEAVTALASSDDFMLAPADFAKVLSHVRIRVSPQKQQRDFTSLLREIPVDGTPGRVSVDDVALYVRDYIEAKISSGSESTDNSPQRKSGVRFSELVSHTMPSRTEFMATDLKEGRKPARPLKSKVDDRCDDDGIESSNGPPDQPDSGTPPPVESPPPSLTKEIIKHRKLDNTISSRLKKHRLTPILDKSDEFHELEAELMGLIKEPRKLEVLWGTFDHNSNNLVSLAEIDSLIVERYPLLNCKPALMRAYKQTCLKDDVDVDAWVEPQEFPMLLMNLFYFTRIFKVFAVVDDDSDRRISELEFRTGLDGLCFDLSAEDAEDVFRRMDSYDSGTVLFDDFCAWYTHQNDPTRSIASATAKFASMIAEKQRASTVISAVPCLEAGSGLRQFDALEDEIVALARDPVKLSALWATFEYNSDNLVSLAEIDSLIVERYPLLNSKPALMQAYKQTCLKDGVDGDAWVEPQEFPTLLLSTFYLNKLFSVFDSIDDDSDRRIDYSEFSEGVSELLPRLSMVEYAQDFDNMDSNKGGMVLFDEVCMWYIKQVDPGREIADSAVNFVEKQKARMGEPGVASPCDA